MGKEWDMATCNEKSGFLFDHDCFRPPVGACVGCRKPVCDDHAHDLEGSVVCTSCAKEQQFRRRTHDSHHHDDYHHYDNDPYFYGGYYYGSQYYYHTYHQEGHHDPHDFTEADAESLMDEGDAGFETDMSES